MGDPTYPHLPKGEQWPAHMIGDAPIKKSLRETYAKISWQVDANGREEKEKILALKWCREHGSPHLNPESTNEQS